MPGAILLVIEGAGAVCPTLRCPTTGPRHDPTLQYMTHAHHGYYDPRHLKEFGTIGEHAPDLAKKFFDWYGAVFQDGALSAREKSLIALGVAHALQCPYCIDAYTTDGLSKGCDPEQLTEVAHVAAAIRGGASLVHGMQMKSTIARVGM